MYIIAKVLLSTQQIELVRKEEFAATALNPGNRIFVIYIAALANAKSNIHSFHQAQIVFLKTDKGLIAISNKYIDFADIFSSNLAAKFPEYNGINNYTINLIIGKQSLYELIHSLESVKLETLKTYIKINLANSFIKSCKSSADALIFFVSKLDGSLYLYVNYQGLNYLIIKN